jgi:aspartate aminotransferase
MFSILNPGDEVIVFAPFWVSYSAIITLADGKPRYINTTIENDFKPTPEQLEEAISNKTKAIIFSSPCNPTGTVFTKEDLEGYRSILVDHPEIIIISDEIYEHINFTEEHISIGSLEGMNDRTITLNGFSKGFAMTGWRLGYLGAPSKIAKSINKMQGQTTSANCSIAQRAGLIALTGGNDDALSMKKEYLKRRNIVFDLLSKIDKIKINKPQGAFYFFPEISNYLGNKTQDGKVLNSANELALYLLEEAKVSLVPGEDFGAPNCIRISYAASEIELIEATQRLEKSLSKLS